MAFSASSSPDLALPKVKLDGHRKAIDTRTKRQQVKSRMDANKKKAKKRDGYRCRWHEPHVCYGILESDHVNPLGMGGDPQGIRSETSNLFSACTGIHQEFDESFHNGLIWPEALTPDGCDGPMRGMKKTPIFDTEGNRTGEYDTNEIWRESRVGVPLVKRPRVR